MRNVVRPAVDWSEPSVIESQLGMSKAVDSQGLTRAFEAALIAGRFSQSAEKVVQTLIEYNAEARYVRYDRLFRLDNDPYHIVRSYLSQLDVSELHGSSPSKGRRLGRVVALLKAQQGFGKQFLRRIKLRRTSENRDGIPLGDVADGFDLMKHLDQENFLGYQTHIDARVKKQKERYKCGQDPISPMSAKSTSRPLMRRSSSSPGTWDDPERLRPTWTDLMMWAVVTGEVNLAVLLWRKTISPMRAAVMASRLMSRIAEIRGEYSFQGLQASEQATLYESWAVGVLNKIEFNGAELLTQVPTWQSTSSETKMSSPINMWRDSVMDQACDPSYPCTAFVACSHCQRLLDSFYHGAYPSSRAAIRDDTSQARLILQIFVNLIHAFTLGSLRCCLPTFVQTFRPDSKNVADVQEESDPFGDHEAGDIDLCYFGGALLSVSKELPTRGGWLARYFYFWKYDWAGFFQIPRVKFIVHTSFFFVYAMLYIAFIPIIGANHSIYAWTFHSNTLYPTFPQYVTFTIAVELSLFAYILGRVVEETHQLYLLKPRVYFNECALLS